MRRWGFQKMTIWSLQGVWDPFGGAFISPLQEAISAPLGSWSTFLVRALPCFYLYISRKNSRLIQIRLIEGGTGGYVLAVSMATWICIFFNRSISFKLPKRESRNIVFIFANSPQKDSLSNSSIAEEGGFFMELFYRLKIILKMKPDRIYSLCFHGFSF